MRNTLLLGLARIAFAPPSDGGDSTFNPDVFMSTEMTEALETKFTPVDEGEFVASVDDIKVKKVKDSTILDVMWLILDDALKAKLNMEKIVVKQSIFLDVEHNGAISVGMNKNVRLGRLRDGLGQNKPGQAWSLRMLKGAGPAKITVSKRTVTKEGAPPGTEPDVYNDVVKVVPLS